MAVRTILLRKAPQARGTRSCSITFYHFLQFHRFHQSHQFRNMDNSGPSSGVVKRKPSLEWGELIFMAKGGATERETVVAGSKAKPLPPIELKTFNIECSNPVPSANPLNIPAMFARMPPRLPSEVADAVQPSQNSNIPAEDETYPRSRDHSRNWESFLRRSYKLDQSSTKPGAASPRIEGPATVNPLSQTHQTSSRRCSLEWIDLMKMASQNDKASRKQPSKDRQEDHGGERW